MKTKFTKASKKDKTLVTVTLAQFDSNEDLRFVRHGMQYGDELCLSIDGQPTIFKVNRIRNGSAITATTHCFPRYLRLPTTQRAVFAEVDQVN